jgi:hypothetical protein
MIIRPKPPSFSPCQGEVDKSRFYPPTYGSFMRLPCWAAEKCLLSSLTHHSRPQPRRSTVPLTPPVPTELRRQGAHLIERSNRRSWNIANRYPRVFRELALEGIATPLLSRRERGIFPFFLRRRSRMRGAFAVYGVFNRIKNALAACRTLRADEIIEWIRTLYEREHE